MDKTTINVLLVDDDEEDYLITRNHFAKFENRGYHLDWCATFEEGLADIRRAQHDVYLLDHNLGERVGLDLLREAVQAGGQKPMIMLTGLGGTEMDIQAIREGAADYLVKGQISAPLLERSIRHSLERSRMQRALSASEERYALAAKGANDGLWDWDLVTGEVFFSSRWKAMLGFEDEDFGNDIEAWLGRVHPDDAERVREIIENHTAGQRNNLEFEYRLQHKDSSYLWMLTRGLVLWDDSGKAYRMTGWQIDLSERMASYDELTGLPNRTLFCDRLTHSIKTSLERKDYDFAVFFLDLDSFKMVNDSLGHAAGDALLIEVAARLEGALRNSDTIERLSVESSNGTVARFGGDEFAVLLKNIRSPSTAISIAERIQKSLMTPFKLDEHDFFTSASIGIALGNTSYEKAEEVLRDADIAMYRAKELGKARHALFDAHMHAHVQAQLALETDLRRALERQEFCLVYQPIVLLQTQQIKGFEALLRWQHPEQGLLAPDKFISIAEETGLILAIGNWVLETACQQLKCFQKTFPQSPPLNMNVNLSVKQLSQLDLVEQIKHILEVTNLDPTTLNLEVTESMIIHDTSTPISVLKQCQQLGVGIQIDDFGTGYSSFSRLNSLPLDYLKIDSSFIRNLITKAEGEGIVQAILTLAKTLNLGIVAEGIETSEQASKLKALDCLFGQGYFFYKPLKATEMMSLMETQPIGVA